LPKYLYGVPFGEQFQRRVNLSISNSPMLRSLMRCASSAPSTDPYSPCAMDSAALIASFTRVRDSRCLSCSLYSLRIRLMCSYRVWLSRRQATACIKFLCCSAVVIRIWGTQRVTMQSRPSLYSRMPQPCGLSDSPIKSDGAAIQLKSAIGGEVHFLSPRKSLREVLTSTMTVIMHAIAATSASHASRSGRLLHFGARRMSLSSCNSVFEGQITEAISATHPRVTETSVSTGLQPRSSSQKHVAAVICFVISVLFWSSKRLTVSPSFSACVVWVAWIWAGNSEQHRRSAQELWAVSCRQPRIGQPLAADRFNHRIQPLKRVPLYVAFIQPESKLVQIATKMLAAHAVVNPSANLICIT